MATTLDISVGRNFIPTFPEPDPNYSVDPSYAGLAVGYTSSHTYPCSTYDSYLKTVYLNSPDLPGVVAYTPGVTYPFFTHFISGSGEYIIDALSAFQIVVE